MQSNVSPTEHAVFLADLYEHVESLEIEEFIASGGYRGFFSDDDALDDDDEF